MDTSPASNLLENDAIVDALRGAIHSGRSGLKHVPALLKRILQEERWRKRIIQRTGEIATFDSFEKFVTTDPLEGLGSDLALIKRICADDMETLNLIDMATTKGQGAPIGSKNAAKHKINRDNITVYLEGPERGTTRQYALRRLRKDRPDLLAQVLAGELTPHGAMVKAGFRKKTMTVALEPAAAVRAIKRHFDAEGIHQIVEGLT